MVLLAGLLASTSGCSDDRSKEGERTHATIDDLPQCNPQRPSAACLAQLFLPLRETEWPFDAIAVDKAFESGATEVLPGWMLTAMHVRQASSSEPLDCYAANFEFAPPGQPIDRGDCGVFLFLGGHPQSAACKITGELLTFCVDRVPVAEAFDIGLVAGPPSGSTLEIRTDVQEDEEVFIVGDPSFLGLLSGDEYNRLFSKPPLVSSGKVLKLDGRGMVLSNLAFIGNSGGPVLDRAGRIVGVVYTTIALLRQQGTPTDPTLADHRTVAVRVDEAMKARIDQEKAVF